MDSFRRALSTPRAVVRDAFTPTGNDSGPISHTNFAFDEVSSEWQAVITESPYEVQNAQSLETVVQNNFGTLDNPHIIFTGDVPFRFVGCGGPPNEDDYDGHEFLLFLLREGPLQRCPSCGQVYKLVRLRDEASDMAEYYSTSLFGQDIQELGEADHFLQQNPIRAAFTNNYEHTVFEIRSDFLYSLANPDDHDRFLVDPAYRLERVKLMQQKSEVYARVLDEIERGFAETHGRQRFNINKVNYENLVTAEVACEELDAHFRRVHKFKLRHMYDPENHERREARMLERAAERLGPNVTIYLNNANDDSIKYEDYFETDNELELAKELTTDYKGEAISAQPMRMENLKFQEVWTRDFRHDHQPILQQKIFKFKYRQALASQEEHARRENRMFERLPENLTRLQQKYDEYTEAATERGELESSSKIDALAKEKAFYDELIRFNVQNYKNYFESDEDTDFDLIAELPNSTRLEVMDGLYLDEMNDVMEKMQLKSITLGSVEDESQGFIGSIAAVYNGIKDELPAIQRSIDSHNVDERSARVVDKIKAESEKSRIEATKAQITDKADK